MQEAMATVLRRPTTLTCAGRTDRGVHAIGQVVSFDADAGHFDAHACTRALNRMLRPDIAVRDMEIVPAGFDARFSCTGRSYRYTIVNRPTPDPLRHDLAWHVRDELDLARMRQAAGAIIGTHVFTSFSKQNKSKPKETYERTVQQVEWHRVEDAVVLDIRADAFTHQMVRSLVGMFVEIGRGYREVEDMATTLAERDRASAPSPAPPQGLVFMQAHYAEDRVERRLG